MVLACLVAPGPLGNAAEWARLLAPTVLLRPVTGRQGDERPADDSLSHAELPRAVLGTGAFGIAAFVLAHELAAGGRPPAQLIVCDCVPPPAPVTPVTCPVTVFAGPEFVAPMVGWRSATTSAFTLRVLDGLAAPPAGVPSHDVVLALREDLAVWPY
jgi:hypothetical protein